MSFIPPGEKIIEKKKCRLSGQDFFVTDKDLEFYDKISPVFGGKKYAIPSPTLCPNERQKRRLCFRNERKLYKRKCDKTGQEIISIYSPEKPYVVYDQKVWWGDDWSPMDYGRSFDFERPFFDQFKALYTEAPKMNLYHQSKNENSEYSHLSANNKNCYLIAACNDNEDCYYDTYMQRSKWVMDSCFVFDLENCYSCVDCKNCFQTYFCESCVDCHDIQHSQDCQSCKDCFCCSGLVNKQYCVLNNQFSREQYRDIMTDEIKKEQALALYRNLCQKMPKKFMKWLGNESVTGDYVHFSKNSFHNFDCTYLENSKYNTWFHKAQNCYDNYGWWLPAEFCYENQLVGWAAHNVCFSFSCANNIADVFYSMDCHGLQNCFGCASLKKWFHTILNTPYSVKDYETLCWKIIDHMRSTGEWWEFFSHDLSPFAYNETVANEYFPMTEKEVKAQWWKWYDGENKNTYIGSHYVPLSISQYDERIVGYETATENINEVLWWIIQCEITKKPFKIIKQELVFYIENGIPIPTKHPDHRHKERMDLRNPRKLYERTCAECQKEIITTYSPDRPERVVCEECYRKLIY